MIERTNQEWLDSLRGLDQEQALDDLRTILVRGLRYGLANYASVTEQDLEDFAQEALLKIMSGLDSFRGESRFTTWANKIAVRVAFSEMRRLRWKDISLQDLLSQDSAVDYTPPPLTDSSPSPEQRASQQMLLEQLQQVISEELTERQQQAMMAKMKGMPLEEIAHRMGTNRNALYKLMHDGRKKLRNRMMVNGLTPQDVLADFEE
jgi:RNA polymerase sigma-70 factor (ECF subfamily)